MPQHYRHQLVIAAVACVAFLTNLGATRLWDQDEAFFAGAAAEMHARGDWCTPYFNDELFSHKPPFMFWAMMLGYQLFGITSFAARIGSAVFGIATALLTYHLGRRLFSAEVGLWAGLCMCGCLMFNVVARAATPDSFLVFFCTAAMYAFVVYGMRGADAKRVSSSDPLDRLLPRSWIGFALMYSLMGVAVLVKGPIGVLLPMAVIGLFLLVMTPRDEATDSARQRWSAALKPFGPRNFFGCLWKMRPLTAIVVVLLVAGPWFALVGWRTDGRFLSEFFGVHNFGRFLRPMDNHRGFILYYLPAVAIGFFPWSIVFGLTGGEVVRQIRQPGPWRDGMILLCCWLGVWVVFFSLASTKLPNYVLPAYPALALMTGCFLSRWIHQPATAGRRLPWVAFGLLIVVGLGMTLGMPAVSMLRLDGQPLLEAKGLSPAIGKELRALAVFGLFPLLGGLAGMWLMRGTSRQPVAVVLCATAVIMHTSLLGFAALRVDKYQPGEPVAQLLEDLSGGEPRQLAQFGFFRPSMVFYTRQRIDRCLSAEDVVRHLDSSPNAFVVTTSWQLQRKLANLPADVVVLGEQQQFPKKGTIVVLSSRSRRLAGKASQQPLSR